ncbi:MAG: tryptophan--tRNA ligase [Bacilli bacterium]|nr:tryptophan--tRNA ligase [Bacilli bacterium]
MKTILSGIQPSGKITLGNYLGAIKNFVEMQNNADEDTNIFIFIADLHAITVYQDPVELRKSIKSLAAIYLACGLDPNKSTIFIQSEVKEHAEIGYLLQTMTYVGELERMTQYKDKMQKQVQGVSSALLTYPVLMAGDILLYNSNYVPVGVDQKQHLELSRTLAERFNNRYSETFNVPEPIIQKVGAKIMSLQDPTSKMSKSDKLEKASIFLLDDEATIRKKIASAVTDSEAKVYFDQENKPGISNLLTILSCCTLKSIDELVEDCKDMNYGEFKKIVADALVEKLMPIQQRYNEILNSEELDLILTEGAKKASYFANKTITKMKRKMGIGRKQ